MFHSLRPHCSAQCIYVVLTPTSMHTGMDLMPGARDAGTTKRSQHFFFPPRTFCVHGGEQILSVTVETAMAASLTRLAAGDRFALRVAVRRDVKDRRVGSHLLCRACAFDAVDQHPMGTAAPFFGGVGVT